MAQTLSTQLTNMDAAVTVATSKGYDGGIVKTVIHSVTVPDTANADEILLGIIPVDSTILDIELSVADLGTTGTIDLGLFSRKLGVNGVWKYTAVDKDCIANNLDITQASSVAIVAQRIAGVAADDSQKKTWEIAGLIAKPEYTHFVFGITTDTGTTAAGKATIKVSYIN